MQPKVSVGPSSVLGWVIAGASFVLAAVVFLTGDAEAKSTLVPTLLGVGGGSHVVTAAGRYVQAHRLLGSVVKDAETAVKAALPTLEEELASPPPAEAV